MKGEALKRRTLLKNSLCGLVGAFCPSFLSVRTKLPFIKIDLTTTNVVKYANLTFSKRKGSDWICCGYDSKQHMCLIPMIKNRFDKEEFYQKVLNMKSGNRFFEIINGDLSNLYADESV